MPGNTEYDFEFDDDEFDVDDYVSGAEPKKPGEEFKVEIKHTHWSGQRCAELYA